MRFTNSCFLRSIRFITIVFIAAACSTAPRMIFHPQDLPSHMKWLMVDNIPVVYTDQGQGDTVLILSTYPLGVDAWDDLSRRLSSSFRVIVVEAPWFREPNAMGGNFSSEHLLQVYRSFIRKLGIKETHVIGVGEGGGLAVAFGHHFPEHIRTAISINGFEGVTWSDKTREMLTRIFSYAEDRITNLMNTASARYQQDMSFRNRLRPALQMPEQKEQIKAVRDRMDDLAQDIKSLYITSMIEYIDFPVLTIRSDNDTVLPEKYAEWSHNRIHGVQYQPLKDAGHYAFMDQPEKVAELIRNFLLSHPGPDGSSKKP